MVVVGQHRLDASQGFALIAVIWTLALLSMLVMSFTLDAYLEGKVASYVRGRQQANALIDSGVAIAEMLIKRQDKVSGDETDEDLAKDRWIVPAIRIKRGQVVEVRQNLYLDEAGAWQFDQSRIVAEGAPVESESGGHAAQATIVIKVEPVPARWNINKLTPDGIGDAADEVWRLILTHAQVPEEDHAELIDSFYDWVDEDSLPRSDQSAESDYYERLDVPYKAKNAPLDTIGELAYIRGFDRNGGVLLKGGVWNPEEPEDRQITVQGIEDLFTVYGDGKVNVNAATKSVLMTVPALEDTDGLIVDTVIEEREGLAQKTGDQSMTSTSSKSSTAGGSLSGAAMEDYHFKDVADLTGRVPGLTQADCEQFLSVDTGVFKLEIEGQVGRIKRRVTAVVEIKAAVKSKQVGLAQRGSELLVLRWQEEF